jgi:hypothetical protein
MKPRKLGYVVANDREEFLVYIGGSPGVSNRTWSLNPAMARIYTRSDAVRIARELGVSYWSLEISETASQYIVTGNGNNSPEWLKPLGFSGSSQSVN